MNTEWRNDWRAFIDDVNSSYRAGLDDSAVSVRFSGVPVKWSGTVAAKRLDIEHPGVEMAMPAAEVSIIDDESAVVDYLYLNLKKDEVALWRNIHVGALLRFETQLMASIGPFDGITWSRETKLILLVTDGARPLVTG